MLQYGFYTATTYTILYYLCLHNYVQVCNYVHKYIIISGMFFLSNSPYITRTAESDS